MEDSLTSLIGGLSSMRKGGDIPEELAGHIITCASGQSKDLFGGFKPVDLEIGCGKGGFILEYHAQNPGRRIAGIEVRHNLAVSIARKINSLKIKDILIIRMDAREALTTFFVPASIERCFILFPDPWWKRRHAKKRLATEDFANMISAIMKENGHIFFATDVLHLSSLFVECFRKTGFLVNRGFVADLPETDREKVIKKRGGDVHYYTFIKGKGERAC